MSIQSDDDVEKGVLEDELIGEPNQPPTVSVSANSIFSKVDSHHGKDLSWSNVNMTLTNKQGHIEKEILKDVWGVAKTGETTAIMGASGAGKTSLFQILSGRRALSSGSGRIRVEAKIDLGGVLIDPNANLSIRTLFAYVAQQDALHEASTPREALTFSARMRLSKATSTEQIDELVSHYLEELGLNSAADTVIGGGLKKGVSGGEKRRTSIGVELVSNPKLIFLDEPTSGLDSFAARQVMSLLDKVAKAGNTVLFTIHQPSSVVFASFDRLILLNKGRLMYTGLTTVLPQDFAKLGYPVPSNYNPADWILDVAQMNEMSMLEKARFFPVDKRPASNNAEKLQLSIGTDHVSLWTEFGLLMHREKISLVRNPAPMIINASITAFLSLVFGVIFYQVGTKDRTDPLVLQGQLGALVNVLISTMMGQSQTALLIFSQERPLFLREYSTNHYRIITYFISHLATEAVQAFVAVMVQSIIVYFMIGYQQTFLQFFFVSYTLSMTATAVCVWLGSIFSDSNSAASMFTLVVVPQFYFSGVFIAVALIPVWIRWAQYLCSLTYASRLGFIYEFSECAEGQASQNCESLLRQNAADPDNTWWYWLALLALFVGFRLMAMVILRKKGKDFQ